MAIWRGITCVCRYFPSRSEGKYYTRVHYLTILYYRCQVDSLYTALFSCMFAMCTKPGVTNQHHSFSHTLI